MLVTSEQWVLCGVTLAAASGLPGLFLSRHSLLGQRLAAILLVLGCTAGLVGSWHFFTTGDSQPLTWPTALANATFTVEVDALSAFFLAPVCLVSLLGGIYSLSYWRQTDHADNGRKLSLSYGVLVAALMLLVVARDGILFLLAWEVMAVAAFFAVATEDHLRETREAAWMYLICSHIATLCLFCFFSLTAAVTGSFGLVALPSGTSSTLVTVIFLLGLVGFGTKAGIMPMHIWLPGAHAAAPSHVSALLSGVVIKMGIYGLVRMFTLMPSPTPVWCGGLILALGVISGVFGVAFAIGQHDIKRLLAYHSIENIGIILLGIGLAWLGRCYGRTDWVALGMAGAILHVWNHGLFKSLLFYSAGSVIHATHTREIDQMGGLAKSMPWTSAGFLIGAVAICGLPPLNGFVSELMIYLGLFRTLGIGGGTTCAWAAFAVPALALIGGLASACFVKVYGATFLGAARHEHARHAHESSPAMLVAMWGTASCCVVIGVAPWLIAPVIQQAIGRVGTRVVLADLVPFQSLSVAAAVLIGLLAIAGGFLANRIARGAQSFVTWDCGYAAPTARMQYTSSSFAEMLVGLFAWALQPTSHVPKIEKLFPQHASFHSEVPDTVLDRLILPCSRWLVRGLALFRYLQQGSLQAYLLYILLILILLFLWQ
jgi:hydrogenase-4 component B